MDYDSELLQTQIAGSRFYSNWASDNVRPAIGPGTLVGVSTPQSTSAALLQLSDIKTSETLSMQKESVLAPLSDEKGMSPFQASSNRLNCFSGGCGGPPLTISNIPSTLNDSDFPNLPSTPSIIQRLNDREKNYIDPKDLNACLPQSLLYSSSLDLGTSITDSTISLERSFLQQQQNHMSQTGEIKQDFSNIPNMPLITEEQLKLLEQIIHLQGQGIDPSFFLEQDLKNLSLYVQPQNNNNFNALEEASVRAHHARSFSEPNFAFSDPLQGFPFSLDHLSINTAAAAAALMEQEQQLQGSHMLKGTLYNDFNVASAWVQDRTPKGTNMMRPDNFAKPQGKIKVRQHKKTQSVDVSSFGLPQKSQKGKNTPRERSQPVVPTATTTKSVVSSKSGSKNTPSKVEVKRLVDYQVEAGQPIRTPWFREKPKMDDEVIATSPPTAAAAPKVPCPNKIRHKKSLSMPGIFNKFTPPTQTEQDKTITPSSLTPRRGTGFFCPLTHK